MSTPIAHGLPSHPTPPLTGESGVRQGEPLLSAFVQCRTTLEDLSRRTGAYGHELPVPVLAAYLTGRCALSVEGHNVVAGAINLRLRELSRPAAAAYLWPHEEIW